MVCWGFFGVFICWLVGFVFLSKAEISFSSSFLSSFLRDSPCKLFHKFEVHIHLHILVYSVFVLLEKHCAGASSTHPALCCSHGESGLSADLLFPFRKDA